MATKLKNFTRNRYTKTLAFIFFLLAIAGMIMQLQVMVFKGYDLDMIVAKDYTNTTRFRRQLYNANEELNMALNTLEGDVNADDYYYPDNYYSGRKYGDDVAVTEGGRNNAVLRDTDAYENPESTVPEVDRAAQLEGLQKLLNKYAKDKYMLYVSVNGESMSAPTGFTRKAADENCPVYFSYQNEEWQFSPNLTIGFSNNIKNAYYDAPPGTSLYLGFTQAYIAEQSAIWQEQTQGFAGTLFSFIGCGIIALLLFIFLLCVTGKKPQDNKPHLCWLDRMYTEFHLIIAFFAILGGVALLLEGIWNIEYNINQSALNMDTLSYFALLAGTNATIATAVSGVVLALLLSITRKLKAKCFIRQSIVGLCWRKIAGYFTALFDGSRFKNYPLTKSLQYRQSLFIVISALLVLLGVFWAVIFFPLAFLCLLGELALIYWYATGNKKTYEEINKGFNDSLEEQMKSERMKISLVTNVSHDLKTPLTSIISYIDLLSKDETLSPEASDYVAILQQKSDKLKNIVADLFDLAKATSGNIQMETETLDIKKLVEQTLADLEDKITQSGHALKTKLPEEPVYIQSDGKKLYRVLQNLLDNALKYSLEGSRIYITLEMEDGHPALEIKNIAGYEMQFTTDEIRQRFVRGDEARSGEGSGLGLSIAESFTNACGGQFALSIDGDLFKVRLTF